MLFYILVNPELDIRDNTACGEVIFELRFYAQKSLQSAYFNHYKFDVNILFIKGYFFMTKLWNILVKWYEYGKINTIIPVHV